MSTTLSYAETLSGGGKVSDDARLIQQTAQFNSGVLPNLNLTLTNGTGTGKANAWYLAQRIVANGANDDLDLYGGLTDFAGNTLNFTKIKRILVAIVSPDGTQKLIVGPQGVTNPFVGPWSLGQGATVGHEVLWKSDLVHPYAGWTVTSGTGDTLRISNPGASPVTYAIFIIGEQ